MLCFASLVQPLSTATVCACVWPQDFSQAGRDPMTPLHYEYHIWSAAGRKKGEASFVRAPEDM